MMRQILGSRLQLDFCPAENAQQPRLVSKTWKCATGCFVYSVSSTRDEMEPRRPRKRGHGDSALHIEDTMSDREEGVGDKKSCRHHRQSARGVSVAVRLS